MPRDRLAMAAVNATAGQRQHLAPLDRGHDNGTLQGTRIQAAPGLQPPEACVQHLLDLPLKLRIERGEYAQALRGEILVAVITPQLTPDQVQECGEGIDRRATVPADTQLA